MNPAMNFGLNVANTAFDGVPYGGTTTSTGSDLCWGQYWQLYSLGTCLYFHHIFWKKTINRHSGVLKCFGSFFLVDTIRLLFANENRWIRLWKI